MSNEPMTLIEKLRNPQRDHFDLFTMSEAAYEIDRLQRELAKLRTERRLEKLGDLGFDDAADFARNGEPPK